MSEIWTMGELLVEIMRPRRGVPLGQAGEFLGPYPSGAPAIFINAAALMGHSSAIIGGVGADEFGSCVVDRLKGHGVDTDEVKVVEGRSTGVAFVAYFEDGSRRFIFHLGDSAAVMTGEITPVRAAGAAFFHIMGCSLMIDAGLRARITRSLDLFAQAGARISFDPNIRPELLRGQDIHHVVGPILESCSILMPGEAELELLTGAGSDESGARVLFDRYPVETIVLKRGSRGSTLFTRKERLDVPSFTVSEIDPTGAGDCFDAGFLCGLIEGRSLYESGLMAAAAGAINATAFGPMEGDISPDSVKKMMAKGA